MTGTLFDVAAGTPATDAAISGAPAWDAPALLAECTRRGVRLEARGDRLHIGAAPDAVADVLEELRAYKRELLALLQQLQAEPTAPPMHRHRWRDASPAPASPAPDVWPSLAPGASAPASQRPPDVAAAPVAPLLALTSPAILADAPGDFQPGGRLPATIAPDALPPTPRALWHALAARGVVLIERGGVVLCRAPAGGKLSDTEGAQLLAYEPFLLRAVRYCGARH